MSRVQGLFLTPPDFCGVCGSILPVLTGTSKDKCVVCREPIAVTITRSSEGRAIIESKSYKIHFNDRNVYTKDKESTETEEEKQNKPAAEGPIVERTCSQCGNNKMSYATVQLRSADEGQTIFFTCVKCGFKENENS